MLQIEGGDKMKKGKLNAFIFFLSGLLVTLLFSCGNYIDNHSSPSFKANNSTKNVSYKESDFGSLVDIQKNDQKSTKTVFCNTSFQTIYQLSINVESGDVLRFRGQIEFTNPDYDYVIRGHIRLLVNGEYIGNYSSQNNWRSNGPHHMPLWCDAIYKCATNGIVTANLQFAASNSSANGDTLYATMNYGHLIVEQYRYYSSVENASNAYCLTEVVQDRSANATSFNGLGNEHETTIYSIQMNVKANDIIRLFGEVTSQYYTTNAMHGLAIYNSTLLEPISPFSTENTIQELRYTPLFVDAVDTPISANENKEYHTGSHTVSNTTIAPTLKVYPSGGHLIGLHYSKISDIGTSPIYKWLYSYSESGAANNYTITANSGWHSLQETDISAQQGDIVRLAGYLQVQRPVVDTDGISCISKIVLTDENDNTISNSSYSRKYITDTLEILPLRDEMVETIPSSGNYKIKLYLECINDDVSPKVIIWGGSRQSYLFVDHFRSYSGE
jgi:hypothetical protein